MPWCRTLVAAVIVASAVACQPANQRARPPQISVQVSVVDESGAPVRSAVMRAIANAKPIEIAGTRQLKVDQPVAGTIEAPGYLPEPFVIDPADKRITVEPFSRVGPSGAERLSFQFGGDVMMGRRYQQPLQRADTPVATTEAGACSVVRNVAPIMAAADASTVNLETIVGRLPSTGAYPAKRPWSIFTSLESSLTADEANALWTSLSGVYPELQDWVARRGTAALHRSNPMPWPGRSATCAPMEPRL